MVNKLLDGVGYLKSKFQTDQLDQKLKQAISEDNWQASSQLLHQIANHAYNYEKEQRIINFIWDKLKQKNWKKVLKALHLVDFLLKYGPSSTIQAFKENIYQFRKFDNYSCFADGLDRGQSVRKQSKLIVDLISDDSRLNDQRSKAKQIKQRMAQVLGSGSHYGSYNNNSTMKEKTSSNAYESYNSNYFSFNKPINQGSLSFGQSVVLGLQNNKKQSQNTGNSKTMTSNFDKNVQKKPQVDNKKTPFNSLSMKLVKPPPKKVNEQKPEQNIAKTQKVDQINLNKHQKTTQNNITKPQSKQNNNSNILDLDFLSFDTAQQGNSIQNNSDILSSANSCNTQTNPSQNVLDFNFLNNLQGNQQTNINNQSPISYTNISNSSQSTNLYNQNLTSQSIYPIQQTNQYYKPQMVQPFVPQQTVQPNYFNINTTNNYNPSIAINNSIKLELNENKVQKQQSLNPSSLIDLSDFRNQLNSIGTQNKKSITETWNW